MLKFNSLRSRLTLGGGIVSIIAMAAVTFSASFFLYRSAEDAAQREMKALLHRYANDVTLEIGQGSKVAATTASIISGLVAAGHPDRDAVEKSMAAILKRNPQFIGTAIAMEPDAFDRKDENLGRFIPYAFTKPDGSTGLEKLTMTAAGGVDEWYTKPVRQNRARVLVPYTYMVDGTQILMTTAVDVVRNGSGSAIGMAAVDMSLTHLQEFASRLVPLGAGRVMIAAEGTWVSHPNPDLLGKPIDRQSFKTIIDTADKSKGAVVDLTVDDNGTKEFISAIPIRFPGVSEQWHLILTVPHDVVLADAKSTLNAMIFTSVLIVGVLLVIVFLSVGMFASPISRATRRMTGLANGDVQTAIPDLSRKDEIGDMARAVDVFRKNAISRIDLENAQAAEQSARQRRADKVDALVKDFQHKMARSLGIVTAAAAELDATAQSMTHVADNTSGQAVASSAAAEETSVNVQTVAAAAEEMVASLQEIERQVLRSHDVAAHAAREAEVSGTAMAALGSAAEQIGAAVTTISSIAGQTNLLALNATIEAARAGEAGRGFAVVAAEVKELAGQTTRATEEIGGQITAIQSATDRAMKAIQQIGRTIASINEVSGMITSTVAQQTAATSEISRNAGEAARRTQDVSANVARVLTSAAETGSAASQVLGAAAELAAQALSVKQEVDDFLLDIQAA